MRESPFGSEFDRFTWLVEDLKARAIDTSPTKVDATNFEAWVVASAWLRQALTFGEALVSLGDADLAEAAGPTMRAMYELWGEMKFLLTHGDANVNAQRVEVTAVLELKKWMAASGHALAKDSDERIERRIAHFRLAYPDVLSSVMEQRQKKRFHWSGLTRSEVLRRAFDDDASKVYGTLSWDVHGTMSAIRDLSVDHQKGRIEFKHYRDPQETREQMSYFAGGFLYYMWELYADRFGVPPVELPAGS